mmetsp:Transcript_5800/g.9981  ORF Transcript_5800/g.9981 Transcript_5800/m.9981 type:complete len:242 (+) Transcript_5800:189-914(+)
MRSDEKSLSSMSRGAAGHASTSALSTHPNAQEIAFRFSRSHRAKTGNNSPLKGHTCSIGASLKGTAGRNMPSTTLFPVAILSSSLTNLLKSRRYVRFSCRKSFVPTTSTMTTRAASSPNSAIFACNCGNPSAKIFGTPAPTKPTEAQCTVLPTLSAKREATSLGKAAGIGPSTPHCPPTPDTRESPRNSTSVFISSCVVRTMSLLRSLGRPNTRPSVGPWHGKQESPAAFRAFHSFRISNP